MHSCLSDAAQRVDAGDARFEFGEPALLVLDGRTLRVDDAPLLAQFAFRSTRAAIRDSYSLRRAPSPWIAASATPCRLVLTIVLSSLPRPNAA